MTVHEFLASTETADLLTERQELDDDALHEAFQLAAEHHENPGADLLRAFALERYS